MRTIALALAVMCARAQTVSLPATDLLEKIRTRMIFNLNHQPNYTCIETIERSSRAKLTAKLRLIDTLRLEVALVDGQEMFAWPGSKKFEDSDVTQFVKTGAIGNGNFGTHAQALFNTRSATFHYRGMPDLEGRKSIRFDYEVPQTLSGYRIRVASASAIVAYHGSFYADAATFNIERIEVLADGLPPALMLASTVDKIDYAVTRIGEGDFLLPFQSELSMVSSHGGEERNHVKFSACRQFSGESVVTFEDSPASAPDAAPLSTREVDLPPGLDLMLVTLKEIDLQTAAVGDPVETRVDHDVKLKGVLMIPKGALATGRITRLEKNDGFTLLGVEFPEIDAPGLLAHVKGRLTSTLGFSLAGRRQQISVRSPLLPNESLIPLTPAQLHLPKGCIMFWRT